MLWGGAYLEKFHYNLATAHISLHESITGGINEEQCVCDTLKCLVCCVEIAFLECGEHREEANEVGPRRDHFRAGGVLS